MKFDLNGDGKHDWKDDAILYHAVESDSEKKKEASSNGNKSRHQNSHSSDKSSSGWGWFLLLCGGYLLMKLIEACY